MSVIWYGVKHGPTPGEILASFTDPEGYTVSIIVGVPTIEELFKGWGCDGTGRYGPGIGPYGTFIIQPPPGFGPAVVKRGYWMNYPESEWNISKPEWAAMPWHARAALEVKQQATAYKPLKVQYEIAVKVDGRLADNPGRQRSDQTALRRHQRNEQQKMMLLLMCHSDAEAMFGKHRLSVETYLGCRYVDRKTEEEIVCPRYDEDAPMPCGCQRLLRQYLDLCARDADT